MNPIGVMLNNLERDRLRAFDAASQAGFQIVHTSALAENWLTGPERDEYIRAAKESGLAIDAVFIGFDGQDYSSVDFITKTVGILPVPEFRGQRIEIALHYCDLAKDLGVTSLAMHLGFMPKDADHPDYQFLLQAVRRILDKCARLGQSLHLETGQESAEELLGFMKEIDRENLAVNFDPANFVLYDTDDPLEALDLLGPHVRGVHCKDGLRPSEEGKLGKDVPLGTGEVDFRKLLQSLQNLQFAGPLIIEREAGPTVREDILAGRAYLERLLNELESNRD